MIIDGIEYEEIIVLPRWAYNDEEWFDIKMYADKKVGDTLYAIVKEEPTNDPISDLLQIML